MNEKKPHPLPLENAGVAPDERYCFSDRRPEPVAPMAGILEDFANWVRARSLAILAYGTGCGSIELRPLVTSRYDVARFGIQMRPTPRQSCVFVIGGYVAIKTLKRIVRSYEQMQNPKFVVALGSCTINGGMYFDSYNTIKQLDLYIPVDVYIAGCMPRPEALVAGFEELKRRIQHGQCEGANRYCQNLDGYKANQKQAIRNWDMPDYNW
jgi:NADH-quinone oxidoreductase subunit B